MKKKFKIFTFGCRANQYEAQALSEQLESAGYEKTEKENFDLCIINSCAVTDNAFNKSKKTLLQMMKDHPKAEFWMTGCATALSKDWPKEVTVIPNADKENFVQSCFAEAKPFGISRMDNHTRAFVKIQDGCDHFCSYCYVPLARGRSRSRPFEEIEAEVKKLLENGYKEIVLTGIDIGDYRYEGMVLADIIEKLGQIPKLTRLRLSSLDPSSFSEQLLSALKECKSFQPSLHLSLQSASDRILKKMRRSYTIAEFERTLDKLYMLFPDMTVSTDVIVGFPSETEEDFLQTHLFIQKHPFLKVHVFSYSPRPHTLAAKWMDERVEDKIIQSRRKKIVAAAEKSSYLCRDKYLGRRLQVLLENKSPAGKFLYGHTKHFLPVRIVKDEKMRPNEEISVEIYENTEEYLIGK